MKRIEKQSLQEIQSFAYQCRTVVSTNPAVFTAVWAREIKGRLKAVEEAWGEA